MPPFAGKPAWARGSAAALGFMIPQRKGREQQRERRRLGIRDRGPSAQSRSAGGQTRTRRKNGIRCSRCLPGSGPNPAGSGQSWSAGPGSPAQPGPGVPQGSAGEGPRWIPEGSRGVPGGDPGSFPAIPLFPSPFSPPALPRALSLSCLSSCATAGSGAAAMAPALGLGLLLGLLGLLGDPGAATKVLHSLHYLHVAVSEPSPGVPQYMIIGFVDGIPFMRYDSERGRMEPLTQWMKDGAEPGYWDEETQRSVRNQHVDARNLETARERYNQSRGLHTALWAYGCDLLSDGSVRGSRRYGYDGRDFISFDLGSGKFLAADSAAEITRRRWEQEDMAERLKNYLKHECPEWLRKYVGFGQKELERKEPPDVHVSGKEEYGTLILSCHAYGFYPNTITVSWMKENATLDQEMEWGGIVPNSDGTFHTWARIEALPEEWEQYRCKVDHPGMLEPGLFAWEPTSGRNLTMAVAVSVIAAILFLTVLIGFGVWKLQSGNTQDGGWEGARIQPHCSGNPVSPMLIHFVSTGRRTGVDTTWQPGRTWE
uniref:Ig-like domain-containing protein n=1 Tax=Taeniopygia guttata TaxID=59729 RepID=A0A674GSQ7_TAEGU